MAQKAPPQVRTDTVKVAGSTLLISADSLYFVEQDTLIILRDTLSSRMDSLLLENDDPREAVFYDSLRQHFSDSSLMGRILDLLISAGHQSGKKTVERGMRPALRGKVVGDIHIRQLDIFGPTVLDTGRRSAHKWAGKANQLHMKTRERVLRRRLKLRKGQVLNENSLLDNERLIRALSYIRDARLLVRDIRGDTLDLLLLTQDVFPYRLSARPLGFEGLDLHLDHINMMGSGHQLFNRLILDTDAERLLGYEGAYRMPDIAGSLVAGEAYYRNTPYLQRYRLAAERNLLVPGIRLAGGISLEHTRRTRAEPWIDNFEEYRRFTEDDLPRHTYKKFRQDYWLGYSFPLRILDEEDQRSRLVVAARRLNETFSDRPPVSRHNYRAFHHRRQWLFSLGLSHRYYRRERLVYGFGRTEDIPIGRLSEITFGPYRGEFYRRFYTGFNLASGNYVKPLGYLSAALRIGGYWHQQELEEGLLQLGLRTFSYPIQWKKTLFRFFLEGDYSRRMSPRPQEDFRDRLLSLNNRRGIRGMRHHSLYGGHRLRLRLESVAYWPFRFFGFRLASFVFADAGMIARHDESLLSSRLYQGYGLGFRIRNDRLAFDTFQLRLALYPQRPDDAALFRITLGGLPIPRLMDFFVRKPRSFRPL